MERVSVEMNSHSFGANFPDYPGRLRQSQQRSIKWAVFSVSAPEGDV